MCYFYMSETMKATFYNIKFNKTTSDLQKFNTKEYLESKKLKLKHFSANYFQRNIKIKCTFKNRNT